MANRDRDRTAQQPGTSYVDEITGLPPILITKLYCPPIAPDLEQHTHLTE